MEVFGSFEADDIVREGNFGVVMSARRAGTKDRRFAIKVFRPPELSMDEQQIAEDTELFLKAAEAQRKAHAAGGAGGAAWAPIYESGTCAGGAWYATDLMQCSFEMLRIMQKEVEADHLRRVIEAIVQGLGALKSAAGRSHGNLRERNVLVTGREDLMRARIVLCDPALRNRGVEDEQRDARDLGNLIHQLVLHRPFQNLADWPLQSSERWQRMGKAGEQWLELTNRLIDPTKTAKPTIEEISASLPGGALKAAPAKKGPDPQAQRAAQEEAARQEAARRKEQEARAEAERRQREAQAAAERKAAEERAERDRIERERQERERQEKERAEKERLEKERAERERLAKEKKEAEAAAAAEKARQAEEKKKAEAAAAAEKARVADEKKKAEDERRRREQEAKEKAAREQKEKEAAERKADAERAARLKAEQEEARRIAAEKQKQKQELEAQRAKDAAPRPQEASASAPVAEPVAEPPVQRAAAAKPAKTGGNKGVVIGVSAAALVALGVGGWILMSGGKKDTPNQTPPFREPGPPKEPPPPPQTTPTIAQLRESAGASLPATVEIDALLRKVADDRINAGMADASPLQRAAREAVLGAAGTLDATLAADTARAQLTKTANDTIRASLVAAAGTSPVERDGLSSLVDSVVAKVNQQMPGGKAENVRQLSVDAVEQLARSRWKDVVTAAVEAKLAGAFASVGVAAVDEVMADWPEDEPSQADLDGLINTAAGINTELDTGASGADFGKAARQAYDALAGQKWFSRVQNNDAVRRARERIEFLEAMSSAVDAGEILQRGQQAASQAVGASELVAVWNRVGAIEAPVALDQLVAVRSATTDEALLSRFSPAARQAVQGAVEDACVKVWQRAAVAAKTDLDIDGVRKQKTALAIPGAVEQQSPAIVFNFSLRDLKAKLAAADQTSIDARKAAANEFLAKVDDAVAAAVGAAAAEPVRWAKEIRDFEPPPPVVDFAQAGPGLAGWQPQADAGGARVTYSLGGQSVVFHRVGDAYLSETEVPVSMFIRVANEQGVYNDIKGNCRDLPRGLKVWFASGASVAKATRLVANQKILNPVQWAGLPAAELEPKDDWPVQWVGARAAMVIAGRMGCRLPTAEEWQAAEKQDGGARANLRDDAFQRVLASARAFPNNDMFPDDGARDARGADVADFADADGVPFFAAVDWGDGARWRNLRGNVAEWVIMSAPPTAAAPRTLADATALRLEYGVAGGSALGPPGDKELVHRDRSPYQGYSDVGFRLAFSAPSASAGQGSIDEQVRSLLAAEYR
ncbi:MAG: hypothetical protein GIKADHBN_03340 [Phycisphaerales bacterium]|nr:hypothetical protein [Phycisphaerales bacterium]